MPSCSPENSNISVSGDVARNEDIISDSVRRFFETLNFHILSGLVSVLGSLANVTNMAVFWRQEFADSINVSLFGLAISDLGALLTLVWMSVCFSPHFQKDIHTFDPVKVQYLTAGWPHVCFARITSYITAYVTLERCLCVTLPLKVKVIMTPKRTMVVILLIFVVMIAAVAPVYAGIRLGSINVTVSGRGSAYNACVTDMITGNTSNRIVSLVYSTNGKRIENISFSINVFAQLSSFAIVIVCTVVLVKTLLHKSRWRETTTSMNISHKDKYLAKMVILLATIFIVCFLPSAVNLIYMICTPGYSIDGKYRNSFQVSWSFLNTLEAINSSVNIIVYYKMSSKYRTTLRKMLGLSDDKEESSGLRNGCSNNGFHNTV